MSCNQHLCDKYLQPITPRLIPTSHEGHYVATGLAGKRGFVVKEDDDLICKSNLTIIELHQSLLYLDELQICSTHHARPSCNPFEEYVQVVLTTLFRLKINYNNSATSTVTGCHDYLTGFLDTEEEKHIHFHQTVFSCII